MEAKEPLGVLKQGQDILFLIFDIMSIAIKHTYPLQQWRTVWTMFVRLLLKLVGHLQVFELSNCELIGLIKTNFSNLEVSD